MSKNVCGRVPATILCMIALLFTMAGCGDLEFFPEYKKASTTPDLFSFPSKTNVPISTTVTSDPITVSGLGADSSPISIRGGLNSKYSINGDPDTDTAGTVKNGDKVTVSHTSSDEPGNITSSILTIGNVTGSFNSTTVIVLIPGFVNEKAPAGLFETSGGVSIISFDGAPGTHVISVKDDLNSTNALYALDNAELSSFTNSTQTITNLDSRLIYLRNKAPSTPGAKVVTTLTIDGVSSTFTLTSE